MVRIQVPDASVRQSLLTAARRLPGTEFKSIFIQRDLTAIQRRTQYERRCERRQRDARAHRNAPAATHQAALPTQGNQLLQPEPPVDNNRTSANLAAADQNNRAPAPLDNAELHAAANQTNGTPAPLHNAETGTNPLNG